MVSRPGDYHDLVLVRVDMNGDGEPEGARAGREHDGLVKNHRDRVAERAGLVARIRG